MSPVRSGQHTRGRSTSRARGGRHRVLAGLLLLAVLAGPPTVLLALVGDPVHVPTALRSGDALTRPIDDATLLWLLITVAWLTWLHLLGCLIVETLQQSRGSSLRMPLPGLLFGANTLLASHLVATLLLTSQPGHSNGLTAFTGAPVPVATVTTRAAQPPSSAVTHPTPDPTRAVRPRASSAVTGPTAPIECRVLPPQGRHHDTLWDIAERHLGDGVRWREIFALNTGRVMPDGQRLTHASRIVPGWILRLPADARVLNSDRVDRVDGVASAAPHDPTHPATAHPPAHSTPNPAAAPAANTTRTYPPAADVMDEGTPHAAGHVPARQQVPAPASATSRPPAHTPAATEKHGSRQAEVTVGLGTLSVATLGLLSALTRRRKVAARRRPVGVRAARPAAELLVAETRLRQQARAADIAATVRLALLIAAPQLPTARVKAVWERPDGGIELVLTEHHPDLVPAPFTSTPRGWLLPRAGQRFLFVCRKDGLRRQDRDARIAEALEPGPDPFPVLLPVGEHDGSACLVNLELFGLISVTPAASPAPTQGHQGAVEQTADTSATSARLDPHVTQLLAAWVPTLAGAPWAELVHLFIPPAWEDLAVGLEHVHLAAPTDPVAMSRPLPPQDRESFTAHDSLDAARRAGVGMADILGAQLSLGYRLQDLPQQLISAALDPLDPNIVVLHEPHPDAHPWTLSDDGRLAIPGVCDALTPVRFDPAEHQLMLRLLEYAQDPPHAAPDDPHRARLDADCPALTAEQLTGPRPAPHRTDLASTDTCSNATCPVPGDPRQDARDAVADDAPPEGIPNPPAAPGPDMPSLSRTTAPTGAARDTAAASKADTRTADPRGLEPGQSAPRLNPVEVGVLGPIVVHGDAVDQPRLQALEMLVYLSLHRQPVTLEAMSEAIWPDRGYHDRTVQNRIGDLRRYLGDNHLVKISGNRWRLTDLVTSDWQRFKTLAGGNPAQQTRALDLVRGIPFTQTKRDWMHLDGTFAETEASIVDLALLVGQRALKTGHYDTARDAAHAGLRACPFDERLYRLGIESAAARDATAEIRQLTNQLNWVMDTEIEPDDTIQPATNELLQHLRDEQDRAQHQQRRRG